MNDSFLSRGTLISPAGIGLCGTCDLFTEKWTDSLGDRFSGKPGGIANGGSMDTWESAGFTILDSEYDMWIKKMRNAFRWCSAFS